MSRKPDEVIPLHRKTLSLCEFKTGGDKGFWLYDETRGMHLAMEFSTERAAFVEALHYYQARLSRVEQEHASLSAKVSAFVGQFMHEEGDE